MNESNQMLRPALGVSWFHCITTRISLGYYDNLSTDSNNSNQLVRSLALTKSPSIKPFQIPFIITDNGIEIPSVENPSSLTTA